MHKNLISFASTLMGAFVLLMGLSCTSQAPTDTQANSGQYFDPSSVAEEAVTQADQMSEILERASLSPIERAVRSAAVKVVRPGGQGHGSGSYLKYKGRHIVVTAAHVVEGFRHMVVSGRNGENVIGRVIYEDERTDLAVLSVPKINSRVPMPYRVRGSLANKNLVGAGVTYTGFPGRHDLLTIMGRVASLEKGYIVVNMYGWFGSSGSGVYDNQGRLLGIVSAIDIGSWSIPIPLDSLVWVAPIWSLDQEILDIRMQLQIKEEEAQKEHKLPDSPLTKDPAPDQGAGDQTEEDNGDLPPPIRAFPGGE